LGLRLDLAFRGLALRPPAARLEVAFLRRVVVLRLVDLPLAAFLFLVLALRAFLRAAAILALRLEALFFFFAGFLFAVFFLAVFLFAVDFLLRAAAIVFSFRVTGFVRFNAFLLFWYFQSNLLHSLLLGEIKVF
jgi:hypothetical protein